LLFRLEEVEFRDYVFAERRDGLEWGMCGREDGLPHQIFSRDSLLDLHIFEIFLQIDPDWFIFRYNGKEKK
jgi:hypothetical protein